MSTSSPTSAVRAPRTARPAHQSSKPNGQWAVDGREPLNSNEAMKAQDNGLNVRERIEQVYARQGFDSIADDDLHGRFRWWGLYTQRKPGIDGGRTATLEPQELEDRYFMLRVRVDGGALTTEQLRTVGRISTEFARGTADITDRHNIQLHWVQIEDVPEIWRRLEAVGLSTTEACGDVPRVILGSPVAGIAADEIIDPTWAINEIARRYIGDPELSNLPRKYKTALTGHPSQDVVHEINDVAFVGLVHPELGPGFDLWVGGGLSVAPRLGERLGAFVSEERVPEVWLAVTRLFRDYGYRRLRNRARLKFLLADWGAERFRQVLQDEFLGYALPDGPPAPPPTRSGDHVGVHEQKDGRFYVGAAPYVGRVSGPSLLAVADLAESVGSTRLRLTPYQKLLVLDVPAEHVGTVVDGLRANGLEAEPSPFRRSTIACTGIEFCKLAIVETKAAAVRVVDSLEERLGDLDALTPIALHINGCPNSCARIQTADIGLKGQLVQDEEGRQVPGYQVHLGGGLASANREEPGLGRTVRGLKVTVDGVAEYVERVVRRYVADRADGPDRPETFAEWAHRADEEALQ
ncbi:MAG: sulfite reductase [Cellulomonas sp. 73-145]|uniref:nitrite/sulfite reductase n=1 Tax=Cellulomonas sp. 73-145 TaxID=1895739 RepID=UPI00092BA0B6|nr:nitrite/sulfite reductase [Cellulomonas sp. 73-145]MBN9328582.1 nitrite/sulfite reductase [Cellulomonas sp.]OJV58258.1 MAG: sulfite reductase [Cellulomonas sp. 73-145]